MPSEQMTVALPPELAADVREAVDTGEYASSSEVVQDALRDWTHRRQQQQNGIPELRTMWEVALADTSPGEDMDEVFDALERKYAALAEAAPAKA